MRVLMAGAFIQIYLAIGLRELLARELLVNGVLCVEMLQQLQVKRTDSHKRRRFQA